jgi:hypothetical protein
MATRRPTFAESKLEEDIDFGALDEEHKNAPYLSNSVAYQTKFVDRLYRAFLGKRAEKFREDSIRQPYPLREEHVVSFLHYIGNQQHEDGTPHYAYYTLHAMFHCALIRSHKEYVRTLPTRQRQEATADLEVVRDAMVLAIHKIRKKRKESTPARSSPAPPDCCADEHANGGWMRVPRSSIPRRRT